MPELVHPLGGDGGEGTDDIGMALLEHPIELVEVVYVNTVRAGGGWALGQLHQDLRIVGPDAAEAPWDRVEQVQIGFTYALTEASEYLAGRT